MSRDLSRFCFRGAPGLCFHTKKTAIGAVRVSHNTTPEVLCQAFPGPGMLIYCFHKYCTYVSFIILMYLFLPAPFLPVGP